MEIVKAIFGRFTSRKFLTTLSAMLAAYVLAGEDGVYTITEIQTIVAPALLYVGVEGAADVKGR